MNFRKQLVIGILLGFPAAGLAVIVVGVAGGIWVAIALTGVVFALFGIMAGAITGGRRSGMAVATPIALLLLLSVAFAGQIDAFLRHDMPILGAAVAGGLLGGVAGASWRGKKARAA